MSDVRFREARQNYPREVAARHHGVAGVAPELVFPGIESRAEDERRKFDYAFADAAQTGAGRHDQGNAWSAPDELRFNGERASRLSRSFGCARADCEEMEKEVNFFGKSLCSTKLRHAPL